MGELGVAFAERRGRIDGGPLFDGLGGEGVAVGKRHFDGNAGEVGDSVPGHDVVGHVTVQQDTDLFVQAEAPQAVGAPEGDVDGGKILGADQVDAFGFHQDFDRAGIQWAGEVDAGEVIGAAEETEQFLGGFVFRARQAVGVGGKDIERTALGDDAGPDIAVQLVAVVEGFLEEVFRMELVEEGLDRGVAVEVDEQDAAVRRLGGGEGDVGGDGGSAGTGFTREKRDNAAGGSGLFGFGVERFNGSGKGFAGGVERGVGWNVVADPGAHEGGENFHILLAEGQDLDIGIVAAKNADDVERTRQVGAIEQEEVGRIQAERAVQGLVGGVALRAINVADEVGTGEFLGVVFGER